MVFLGGMDSEITHGVTVGEYKDEEWLLDVSSTFTIHPPEAAVNKTDPSNQFVFEDKGTVEHYNIAEGDEEENADGDDDDGVDVDVSISIGRDIEAPRCPRSDDFLRHRSGLVVRILRHGLVELLHLGGEPERGSHRCRQDQQEEEERGGGVAHVHLGRRLAGDWTERVLSL